MNDGVKARCKSLLRWSVLPVLMTAAAGARVESAHSDSDADARRISLLNISLAVDAVADVPESTDDLEKADDALKAREEALLAKMLEPQKSVATEAPPSSGTALRLKKVEAPTPSVQPPKPPPPAPRAAPAAEPSPSQGMKDLASLKNHPAIERPGRAPVRRDRKDETEAEHAEFDGGKPPSDPSQKLAIAESQVQILSRELDTTRRSLRSAEERIDELSTLVRETYQSGPVSKPEPRTIEPAFHDDLLLESEERSHTVPIRGQDGEAGAYDGGSRTSDVATIVSDREALRIGPGRLESALFVMPRNTQVVVERRTGEWYRVVTPAGARGWVYGPALVFGSGIPSESAIRVRAARPDNEPTRVRY